MWRRSHLFQYLRSICLQSLIGANKIIGNSARLAQVIHGHPVFVHALRVLIQQVTHKLSESHVITGDVDVLGMTFTVTSDDLSAVLLLVRLNLAELVAVRRKQALHGLAHEHEFVVVAQAVPDLVRLEVGQEEEVGTVVHLALCIQAGQGAAKNLQHALPVGASHFGHVAVEKSVLLAHQDVLQQRLALEGAQRPHVVWHVLLAAHGADGPVTNLMQNLKDKLRCSGYCLRLMLKSNN